MSRLDRSTTGNPHPRIPHAAELRVPAQTAAELGYRMPAEWEPQEAVWLTVPHNPETWPGCLPEAQAQHAKLAEALAEVVEVRTTQDEQVRTNDSWIRDFGPIFVTDGKEGIAAHDFRFNGWGGKYESRDLDDIVPQEIARRRGFPLWIHDFVLEGGSIDVNGRGTVLTTEQCLLNDNRNPDFTRDQIEARLHDALGTTHAIWLPGGIVGDDTDGHIDDIARFVNADTAVAVAPPEGHPDHAVLSRNLNALRDARDQDGRNLNVMELPAPDPIHYDFPPDRFGPGGVHPVPASYANFLISNGSVFVPVFGRKSDDAAARVLEQAMPGFTIVPLRAEHLVVGLGAFHCLSQQQPKV